MIIMNGSAIYIFCYSCTQPIDAEEKYVKRYYMYYTIFAILANSACGIVFVYEHGIYIVQYLNHLNTYLSEQVNKKIKEILTNRFRMIIQQMDQSEMRQHLYQQQLLIDAEYETLLSSATPAGANERLFFMIKKKGTAVFYTFLNILQNTSHECPAHVDLYDTLESDLKVAHILTLYKDVTV